MAVAAYSASTGDIIYSIVNMLLFSLGFSFTLLILAFVLSKMNLEKIIKAAGFIDINIVTKPVSREYEEKWGRSLSIGEYIMSSAINAKKPL